MADPIQAGSLASVIVLADNPPDQPLHSWAGDLQQPLVLYIARVPGSHDVFLTLLKPQQRVVTAQDVQSSLYYMHVDRPEDYELIRSLDDSDHLSDQENVRGEPRTPTSTNGVRRKPLPQNLGFDDYQEPPREVDPYFHMHSNGGEGSSQPKRKPLSQDNTTEHRPLDGRPPLPDRKLLGPRPMNQSSLAADNVPLQDVPEKQNFDLRRSEHPGRTPPKLPPRPFSEDKDRVPMTSPRPLVTNMKGAFGANGGHSRFLHRKGIASSASQDLNRETRDGSNTEDLQETSLSLIRRYNNEQWTVGKIVSKGAKPAVSESGESSDGISISILTRGYLRFIESNNSFANQERIIANGTLGGHAPIMAAAESLCFQRHLQVSEHAMSRSSRHRPESFDYKSTLKESRSSFDLPRHSSDSINPNHRFSNGLPELKSGPKKGYLLRSPWDGLCEFTTGVAGRSFKCKHSYASSNPRFGPGMHTAHVSELRFNLPSSKTFGTPASKSIGPGTPRDVKRSSLFMHRHRLSSSSSTEPKKVNGAGYFGPKVELEERLDLSLGQEHAGGGFGGKQAKLGKLIIENEGLQMLDLIVAANMALWWRVYERFT